MDKKHVSSFSRCLMKMQVRDAIERRRRGEVVFAVVDDVAGDVDEVGKENVGRGGPVGHRESKFHDKR